MDVNFEKVDVEAELANEASKELRLYWYGVFCV